jgi:hypothetical protein
MFYSIAASLLFFCGYQSGFAQEQKSEMHFLIWILVAYLFSTFFVDLQLG